MKDNNGSIVLVRGAVWRLVALEGQAEVPYLQDAIGQWGYPWK